MKKRILAGMIVMVLFALASCGGLGSGTAGGGEPVHLTSLKLAFAPSRPADEINEKMAPLPELLKTELANRGYEIDEITITVPDSHEAAGEMLGSGKVDLAWLMPATYIECSDKAEVILGATRVALSNDSENPADWNGEGNKTLRNGPQVPFYKGLIYAGPSAKGKAIAEKVNNGEEITWEELNDATWCLAQSPKSNAGYAFPAKWIKDHYQGHTIKDLEHVVQGNFADAFSKVASEEVDIIVCYADGRNDYEEQWSAPVDQDTLVGKGFGREASIWEELNVIGVTDNIYNDTIAITKANEDINNEQFKLAFIDSILAISKTEEGQDIISVYTHEGYAPTTDADYDLMRAALNDAQ